jgi:hypothetical protein
MPLYLTPGLREILLSAIQASEAKYGPTALEISDKLLLVLEATDLLWTPDGHYDATDVSSGGTFTRVTVPDDELWRVRLIIKGGSAGSIYFKLLDQDNTHIGNIIPSGTATDRLEVLMFWGPGFYLQSVGGAGADTGHQCTVVYDYIKVRQAP